MPPVGMDKRVQYILRLSRCHEREGLREANGRIASAWFTHFLQAFTEAANFREELVLKGQPVARRPANSEPIAHQQVPVGCLEQAEDSLAEGGRPKLRNAITLDRPHNIRLTASI